MSKPFPLGDLLSITSGFSLSLHGVEGTAGVLTHMVGYPDLHPDDVDDALDICRHHILLQHPWMGGISPTDYVLDQDSMAWLWAWLDVQELKYGKEHQLEPLPEGAWQPEEREYAHARLTVNGREIDLDELPEEVRETLAELLGLFGEDDDDYEDDDED